MTGTSPRSVAIGDFNDDGISDLAVANTSTNNVSVLLGTGSGGFGAKTDFAAGTGAYGVAIGDVNLDGRPDLAVVNNLAATVSVLLGNGTGGFGTKTDFATGTNPRTVVLGDLNRDGKPDLVTANSGTNNVSVLLGNGTGTTGGFAKTDFATATFPFAVAIGDVDRNGTLDVAVVNENSNSVSILLGDGAGGLGPKTDFSTGSIPHAVSIVDLNGDAKPDLAVANTGSSNFSVLLGDGAGGFGPKTDYVTGISPFALAVSDVNFDGRADVAVANQGAATASVLLGDGSGGFGPKTDFATGTSPQWVAFADLDGDGRVDLTSANNTDATVSVLLNAYPLPAAPLIFGRSDFPTGGDARAIAVGDLNRDGKPDAVVASATTDSVAIFLGLGNGGFMPRTTLAVADGPQWVEIADLNRDGKPDLAVANVSGSVSVLLGNGDGTLGSRTDFPVSSFSTSVRAGDLNRDGKPDLVAVNAGSNSVSWLRGNGDGTFLPKIDLGTGSNPLDVAIGDLNRDGRLDLAVANHGAATVSVLLGTVGGGFVKTDFATASLASSVALGDLNRDGRLDVATPGASTDVVSVLLNTTLAGAASPTFLPKADVAVGNSPSSAAIDDLDGDGKPDVISLNSGIVSVLVNTTPAGGGSPSFVPRIDYPVGMQPLSLVAVDLNRDGRRDLVVANRNSATISSLLNGYFTLIASAGPHGVVSPTGPVAVAPGSGQGFAVTPDSCYVVADVLVDGVTVGPAPSYTLTNVHADHTIATSFGSAAGSAIFSPDSLPLCGSTGNPMCATSSNYEAILTGLDEVPPTGSSATGLARFRLDSSNILHYSLQFSGLTGAELSAHLHGPALPGQNAGVLFALPTGNPISGQLTLTPTQVSSLRSGMVYANVHSSGFPGGEIRGQLNSVATSFVWSLTSTDPGWVITAGQGSRCIAYTAGSTASALFKVVMASANGCRDSSTFADSCTGTADVGMQSWRVSAIRSVVPNPMGATARIDYVLASVAPVRLEVLSLSGQRIRTLLAGTRPAGPGSVVWNGRSDRGARVAAGVYLLRFATLNATASRKVVMLH